MLSQRGNILRALLGVVEDDKAGAEHGDRVEDVTWLVSLRHNDHLAPVQPLVSGLHLLPGEPAQRARHQGKLQQRQRRHQLAELLAELRW